MPLFACRGEFKAPADPSAIGPALGARGSATADRVPGPTAEVVVGVVVFRTHKGVRAEAILDGEGRWRCPELPVLDRVLNILYEPGRVPRGDLPFGYAELIRVAEWLRGVAKVRRP